MEFFHLVEQHIQVFASPQVLGRAHLGAQLVQKFGLVRDLLPDLRQEGGPAEIIAQDDPIHAGMQLIEQLLRRAVCQRLGHGQARDFDLYFGQFFWLDRGETIILQGGRNGMFTYILSQ